MMSRLLGILFLVAVFGLPAFAQAQQMSPGDQDKFNSYYSHWQQARNSNDRDDMVSMENRMQDLMNKYAIPADTPYDEVASQNGAPGYGDRDRDYRDRDRDRAYAGNWQGRMSADDQRKFDDEYRKWQESSAKNDRDDIDKHARKMEEIMARYSIPPDTPFDAIATRGYANGGYNNGGYVNQGYGRRDERDYRGRMSPDDQAKFDKSYQHYLHEESEHDRNGMAKEEGHMQEIMARYRIPRDVPYDALASNGGRY
jgi:hypothetical protein